MTRQPRSRATRSRILEGAAERFAADGYHGTSYSSLLEATGLSKGALYFHFPSKLDLAVEAYRVKQQELIQASLGRGRGSGSALERLFAALEARAGAYMRDRSFRILPRLSTDFARDPDLVPLVRELHANAVGAFTSLLREAQEAGEIAPEVDLQAVARTIFATIVGMDEVSERESGGSDLMQRSREFIRLLRLALVRTSQRPESQTETTP